MPATVLVFDMDGVLVDVAESYREAIRQTVFNFTGQPLSRAAMAIMSISCRSKGACSASTMTKS